MCVSGFNCHFAVHFFLPPQNIGDCQPAKEMTTDGLQPSLLQRGFLPLADPSSKAALSHGDLN